jgi:hypothetical protein
MGANLLIASEINWLMLKMRHHARSIVVMRRVLIRREILIRMVLVRDPAGQVLAERGLALMWLEVGPMVEDPIPRGEVVEGRVRTVPILTILKALTVRPVRQKEHVCKKVRVGAAEVVVEATKKTLVDARDEKEKPEGKVETRLRRLVRGAQRCAVCRRSPGGKPLAIEVVRT